MDPATTIAAQDTAKPLFRLGRIVATPGALEDLRGSQQCPSEFLSRHVRGDWGEVDKADAAANSEAVAHEGHDDRQGRVLSAYRTKLGERLWLITEWDRSVTTLLRPDEY